MVRLKYKMHKSLNISKGCFRYGNTNTYNYVTKEVECDGQGDDRMYWLKIEQVLPRLFYQISSSSYKLLSTNKDMCVNLVIVFARTK